MPRFTVLSSSYPPETGTTPLYVQQIAEGLAQRGHQVKVITSRPRGYMSKSTATDHLNVKRTWMPQFAKPSIFKRKIEWLAASIAIPFAAIFSRGQSIIFSPPLPMAFLATLLRRRSILWLQDLYPKTAIDVGLISGPTSTRLWLYLERATYRRSAAIIVDSEINKRHVQAVTGTPVHVLPHWWNESVAEGSPAPSASAHFVYGGMLSPHQDILNVARAAKLLDPKKVRISIYGDGPEKELLKVYVESENLHHVHVHDFVARDDFHAIVRSATGAIVNLAENVDSATPGKVLALMSHGVPIIAAVPANGPVPPLIRKAEAGKIVPPNQPKALADAITAAVEDSVNWARLGKNGAAYVAKHATLENRLDQLEELLGVQG